jgi:hypothetical protein
MKVTVNSSGATAKMADLHAKISNARGEELNASVDQYGASVDTLNSLRSSTKSIGGWSSELVAKNDNLINKKDGRLRDAHMDTYTAKRYKAHSRTIFIFTIFCVCAIVVLAIRNMGYIGTDTANLGIGGIAIVGGIAMVYQIVDLTMRDNMDYDAYAWNYNPNNHSPTVYEYNKAQFGKLSGTNLSAFGISTCADASCCGDGTTFDRKLGKCASDIPGDGADRDTDEMFTTINESVKGKFHMGGKRSVDHVVLPSPPSNVTPLSTHTDCASCTNHV